MNRRRLLFETESYPDPGLYYYTVDKKYYTEAEYSSIKEQIVGIAVITEDCHFVIPSIISKQGKFISNLNALYSSEEVNHIMRTDSGAEAQTDYNGYNNSKLIYDFIFNLYGAMPDNYLTSIVNARLWGSEFNSLIGADFPQENYYIPAVGEWNAVYKNMTNISSMRYKLMNALNNEFRIGYVPGNDPIYTTAKAVLCWASTLAQTSNRVWIGGLNLQLIYATYSQTYTVGSTTIYICPFLKI